MAVALGFNNPKTGQPGQQMRSEDLNKMFADVYGEQLAQDFPVPRRREAIEHTRRKLGL
jgi:hypothetical protein